MHIMINVTFVSNSPHPKLGEETPPKYETVCKTAGFKCLWMAEGGRIYDYKPFHTMLEIGATDSISKTHHQSVSTTHVF